LAKRLSEKEKKEVSDYFVNGITIEELSKKFNFTKLTISRSLKKSLGEEKYKELVKESKIFKINNTDKEKKLFENNTQLGNKTGDQYSINEYSGEELIPLTTFTEIIPLNEEIENSTQKDFSSVPISEIDLPNIVYMIVDKKIELQTKYLKDYPEWQFLSQEELNRKTIEIFFDLKIAKRFCNKEQKVIKVPNTEVFKIVAPLLLNRGISRIVSSDRLIAL
tara:strand:+ start:544 stop:1206 length:663 start_codon:yes stop_codon:yes gene_type:complete